MSAGERLGAWDGPFEADKQPVELAGDTTAVHVNNGKGHRFCTVYAVGADRDVLAAKARATRIAEALNAKGPDRSDGRMSPQEATRFSLYDHASGKLVAGVNLPVVNYPNGAELDITAFTLELPK